MYLNTVTREEILDLIRHHVWYRMVHGPVVGIGDDQDISATGAIDSIGILELADSLEKEFGIQVDDDELIPANLGSISDIAAFVEKKLGQSFK